MPKGQGGKSGGQRPRGGAGGVDQMMQQVQKMQADMAAAQEALAATTVEGIGGWRDGQGGRDAAPASVQSVRISPEVVDPDDVEMLEDLVRRGGRRRRCAARRSCRPSGWAASPAGIDLGGLGGLLG